MNDPKKYNFNDSDPNQNSENFDSLDFSDESNLIEASSSNGFTVTDIPESEWFPVSFSRFKDPDEYFWPLIYPNNDRLGFEFYEDIFDGVIIHLNKDSFQMDGNNFKFNYSIDANPNNLTKEDFSSDKFSNLVQRAINQFSLNVEKIMKKEEK